MNQKRIFFLVLGFFLLSSLAVGQVPPPPPPPPGSSLENVPPAAPDSPSETQKTDKVETKAQIQKGNLKARFINLQSKGSIYINSLLKDLRGGFHLTTFLTVILFSLAYGAFHTLGPGHGKLVIVSYFVERKRGVRDAAVLSVIISLIHGSGAIIMALLFCTLLSGVKGTNRIVVQYSFTLFSGILLIALGTYYLIKKIRDGKSHEHNEIDLSEEEENRSLWRRNLAAGFSIGIVPCPLSLTIMTISIVSGIFWVGISSVIALTLSMSFLLFLLSYYTIKTRELAATKSNKGEEVEPGIFSRLLSYSGTLSMVLLGFYITYRGWMAISIWKG